MTKSVRVNHVTIGGGAPVSVQSMTNTDTADVAATLQQIKDLAEAGCDIVRVSVYNQACAEAVKALVDQSPVPLVADIHFDASLAMASIENGIHKLRLNPGNITDAAKVKDIADCAKAHGVPIRIGVNTGSVPKDLLSLYGGLSPQALVASAERHVRMLEAVGFDQIVLSMKASDVRLMVDSYRLASKRFEYPLHIGVTEAGLAGQGTIKSAIGLGALLLDGIGDTMRVSLSGSPIPEADAALSILRALGLRGGVQLVSCPTCGRTDIDVESIARDIEEKTKHVKESVTIAVMGCIVNGPGEAGNADIALCGGKGSAALYVKGQFKKKITGDYVGAVLDALAVLNKEKTGDA